MDGLFQEVSIGEMKVRNRFVRSATWDGLADENGEVTEPMLKVYRDLALGGVGLILTGFAFVDKRGKAFAGMLGVDDDSLVPGLSKLAGAVHEEGGKVVLQIAHGGSQGMFKSDTPKEAPSAVEERATHNMPVEMSKEDIERVVAGFAEAARRAKEAGFDGVQMHGAHGYLLSQFLSPYSNVRSDEYGGSIENRARAVFEVYEAIRDNVGPDYPVMIKINRIVFKPGTKYAIYVPTFEFHMFFQRSFGVFRSAVTADYDYRRQDMGFGMNHALQKYTVNPGIAVDDNLYFRKVFDVP